MIDLPPTSNDQNAIDPDYVLRFNNIRVNLMIFNSNDDGDFTINSTAFGDCYVNNEAYGILKKGLSKIKILYRKTFVHL